MTKGHNSGFNEKSLWKIYNRVMQGATMKKFVK